MIIVLEGTDGTGKSTVGRILAEKLNGVYFPTPPERLKEERAKIDAEASDEEHYLFYLQVVQEASRELESMTGNVVVDRYWMTTVAYHRAMGLEARHEDFGLLVEPDLTVFLEVSPEVQLVRIDGRGWTPGDVRMRYKRDSMRTEYETILACCVNILRITTDAYTPAEIASKIMEHISPRLNP